MILPLKAPLEDLGPSPTSISDKVCCDGSVACTDTCFEFIPCRMMLAPLAHQHRGPDIAQPTISSPGQPRPKGSRGQPLPALSHHPRTLCGIHIVWHPGIGGARMAEMLGTILACQRSGISPRGLSGPVWGYRYFGIDHEDDAEGRCGVVRY